MSEPFEGQTYRRPGHAKSRDEWKLGNALTRSELPAQEHLSKAQHGSRRWRSDIRSTGSGTGINGRERRERTRRGPVSERPACLVNWTSHSSFRPADSIHLLLHTRRPPCIQERPARGSASVRTRPRAALYSPRSCGSHCDRRCLASEITMASGADRVLDCRRSVCRRRQAACRRPPAYSANLRA